MANERKITNGIDVEGSKIINLGTPTSNTDAATKSYVDITAGASSGLKTVIPFTFDATYTTTGGPVQAPLQILIGSYDHLKTGATNISCILIAECSHQQSGEQISIDLYSLTDGAIVSGSSKTEVITTANVFQIIVSNAFTLSPNKSYRVRLTRTSGTGANKALIRAAKLSLTLT